MMVHNKTLMLMPTIQLIQELADDENGISFNNTTDILTSDDQFLVEVTATNNTTSDATVVGWIDFDSIWYF